MKILVESNVRALTIFEVRATQIYRKWSINGRSNLKHTHVFHTLTRRTHGGIEIDRSRYLLRLTMAFSSKYPPTVISCYNAGMSSYSVRFVRLRFTISLP